MDAGAVHCQAAKCSAALCLSSTTEKHKNKTVKSWKEQSDMEHGTELNSSKEGKHLNLPSEAACTLPHKYTYMHLPSPHLLVSLYTCSLLTASSFVQPQPPYTYDIYQSLISLERSCDAMHQSPPKIRANFPTQGASLRRRNGALRSSTKALTTKKWGHYLVRLSPRDHMKGCTKMPLNIV